MKRRELNFISKSSHSIRTLQVSTFFVLAGCATLGSLLVGERGQTHSTASIGDAITTTITEPSKNPRHTPVPKAISEQPVAGFNNESSEDTIRYYEKSTGKSFATHLASQLPTTISDTRIPGFLSAQWSPKSHGEVIATKKPLGTEYTFVDASTRRSTKIGIGLISVRISPDGNHIAYAEQGDAGTLSIVVATIDGKEKHPLLTTRLQDPELQWRTNNELVVRSRRPEKAGYDATLIDLEGNMMPLLSNKENLEMLWSPTGDALLYSYFTPSQGVSLWIHILTDGADIPLNIQTSAQKCAWHQSSLALTCGVPSHASLARDIPANETATQDDIYTLDITSGTVDRIYTSISGTLVGVTHPLMSSSGTYFVFINMFDSKIFSIPVK